MPGNLQVFQVPVSNDGTTMRNVVLYIPTPLSGEEWVRLNVILETMRPALVKPEEGTF